MTDDYTDYERGVIDGMRRNDAAVARLALELESLKSVNNELHDKLFDAKARIDDRASAQAARLVEQKVTQALIELVEKLEAPLVGIDEALTEAVGEHWRVCSHDD